MAPRARVEAGGRGLRGVALALLAAAGCAAPPPARVLGPADAGQLVLLAPGQELELRLPGNPTTGYLWEVAAADPAILAVRGEPEHQPSSDRPGAGGVTSFRWRAREEGHTALRLVYRRPWEREVAPAARWEAAVDVRAR